MDFILNVLWVILGGGWLICLEYLLAGVLLCLTVVGIPFVTKLGIGAAMTVVGAVFTAVTLLPAILALLGHRVNSAKLPT